MMNGKKGFMQRISRGVLLAAGVISKKKVAAWSPEIRVNNKSREPNAGVRTSFAGVCTNFCSLNLLFTVSAKKLIVNSVVSRSENCGGFVKAYGRIHSESLGNKVTLYKKPK